MSVRVKLELDQFSLRTFNSESYMVSMDALMEAFGGMIIISSLRPACSPDLNPS